MADPLMKKLEDARALSLERQSARAPAQHDAGQADLFPAVTGLDIREEVVDLSGVVSKSHRSVFNELAWCGLFKALPKTTKGRRILSREEIPCLMPKLKVFHTGPEFDQQDLDVFMAVVFLGFDRSKGCWKEGAFTFKTKELLDVVGWPPTGPYYERAHESIMRLAEGTVWISYPDRGFTGQRLIEVKTYARPPRKKGPDNCDEDLSSREGGTLLEEGLATDGSPNSCWTLCLPADVRYAYRDNFYTRLQVADRRALSPTGRWLLTWILSLQDPPPIKLHDLWRTMGSTEKRLTNFKARVTESLDKLRDRRVIASYSFFKRGEDEMLKVVRVPNKERLAYAKGMADQGD